VSAVCLGIPGRIDRIDGDGLDDVTDGGAGADGGALRMGTVDFGGVRKRVCLAYVPQAQVGDYVVVHVGFAISQVAQEEAARTLKVLRAMGDAVEAELGQALP
jgi:hydrogenase expression/formation protein HypC